MWNRFTQSAQRAVWHADRIARELRSSSWDTEHLLLGLLIENNGISAQIFEDAGVELETVQRQIVSSSTDVAEAHSDSTEVELVCSDQAKRALELTYDEARRMNLEYIGTEHLLLGLLRQKEGQAFSILAQAGLELEATRARIKAIISP